LRGDAERQGGEQLLTTMRNLHDAIMVPITVGFLAGLIGLFVIRSALESDRRLVLAGYSPGEAIAPRRPSWSARRWSCWRSHWR
jgi:hypothetical protein